jgi:sugar phosphate isomerase/epimerase
MDLRPTCADDNDAERRCFHRCIYKCEAIVRGMGSKAFGIVFGIGNVMTTFEDTVLAARVFGPDVIDAHAKDPHFVEGALTLAPFGQGYVDFPKALGILAEDGYQGPPGIEASPDEGDEDAFLQSGLGHLRAQVAALRPGSGS